MCFYSENQEQAMYTVELYKQDARTKTGERLVHKTDHSTNDIDAIRCSYTAQYPASKGYRFAIHETYVTRKNLMSGENFQERYDQPYFCSPSSESYWCS
jgi:hypothetical protein